MVKKLCLDSFQKIDLFLTVLNLQENNNIQKSRILLLQDESGSSIEDGTDDAVFTLDMSEEEPELAHIARTVSLPMIHGDKKEATEAWANHQYASSCHFFSDGDITPIVR